MTSTSSWLIAPFAAWMVLMSVLPSTLWAYAVRTAITAILLGVAFRHGAAFSFKHWGWGIGAGLLVFFIWILPEQFDWSWYRRFFIVGEGGTCGLAENADDWSMLAIRLLGSALVISIAEELFFRKWLIKFAGFWPMVVLFAIEHDRYLVGAIAGMVYGWLYLRKGLGSAIIAHAVTNMVLGFWVLQTGQWQFW